MKPSCLYFDIMNYSESSIRMLEDYFSVTKLQTPDDVWGSDQLYKGIDVLCCPLGYRFGSKELGYFENLKVLLSNTTGIPHISRAAASDNGIYIAALHDDQEFLESITPTGELAIGLAIILWRNVLQAATSVKKGEWERRDWGGKSMLSRASIGLIGLGRIGKYVANVASSIGMVVYYFDPYIEESHGDFRRCYSLLELASVSDIVSLHCTADESNRHMIGREFFESLKSDSSILINTARGELVDSQALIDALTSGKLKAAALDTVEGEFREDFLSNTNRSDLIRYSQLHDNLLITPHIGGSTIDAWSETEKRVIIKAATYMKSKDD